MTTTVYAGQANTLTFQLLARADGTAITTGTVVVYLRADTGSNAGKWYKASDGTWSATEQSAGTPTHLGSGNWALTLASAVWTSGVDYTAYAEESGNLQIPVLLDIVCNPLATPSVTTPASVRSVLRIMFGANAAGASNKQTLIDDAIVAAAGEIWRHARWPYRHRKVPAAYAVTVPGTGYFLLPADYEYDPEACDYLTDTTDGSWRIAFCEPVSWADECNRILADLTTTTSSPRIWTFGMEDFSGTQTPVIRLYPDPNEARVIDGLCYWAGFPGVDVTSTTPFFWTTDFDEAWKDVCVAKCVGMGLKLIGQLADAPTGQHINDILDELRVRYIPTVIPHLPRDSMRVTDQLAVVPITTGGISLNRYMA